MGAERHNPEVRSAAPAWLDLLHLEADGALSEARHLAYYRAMSVRTQLISHKVLAAKIKIKVIDVSDKARGSTVDLFSE